MLTNQRGNNIKQQLGIQQEKNDATTQDYGEEIKDRPVTCTKKNNCRATISCFRPRCIHVEN